MTRIPAQTPDTLKVLTDLSLLVAGLVWGCRDTKKRQVRLAAIHQANQALRAGTAMQNSLQIPTDPELLIRAYLDAHGDWRTLIAVINRMALEASTRRPQ